MSIKCLAQCRAQSKQLFVLLFAPEHVRADRERPKMLSSGIPCLGQHLLPAEAT